MPATNVLVSGFELRLRIEIAIPVRVTVIPKYPIGDILSPKSIHPNSAANGGANVISS